MTILRPHAARYYTNGASLEVLFRVQCARRPIRRPILDLGAKFPKMWDSLPMTPTNHSAKFDAADFILPGDIRNRTNKQKTNRRPNRYIHTLPNGKYG